MAILFIALQILAQLLPFIIQFLQQHYGASLKAGAEQNPAYKLYTAAVGLQASIKEFLDSQNAAKHEDEEIMDWVTRIMKG